MLVAVYTTLNVWDDGTATFDSPTIYQLVALGAA